MPQDLLKGLTLQATAAQHSLSVLGCLSPPVPQQNVVNLQMVQERALTYLIICQLQEDISQDPLSWPAQDSLLESVQ